MIYHPDTTDFPGGQEQFIRDYTPSAGRMFSEGIDAGFRDVSFMLAKSVMDMDAAENAPLLTKEDWETSKFYDPEIKWDDSFTTPKARLLKERRDRERELGFLLERAGIGSTAAFYGGALVGTVPDPVNYLPFVGIASKAKSAAVLGKIAQSGRLGRGATTAADAVLGTALIQPLVFAERDTYQLKYDTRDALTELGLALGLGFGLGAALGPIHPKDRNAVMPKGRATPDGEGKPDLLPEIKVRIPQALWDSVAPQDKVEAVAKKIASDGAGQNINVGATARAQPQATQAAQAADPTMQIPEEQLLNFKNDRRVPPEPARIPDDTPISANEARLQQLEAELDERIRIADEQGNLKENDARDLAYLDEELEAQVKYHQAIEQSTECLITNG